MFLYDGRFRLGAFLLLKGVPEFVSWARKRVVDTCFLDDISNVSSKIAGFPTFVCWGCSSGNILQHIHIPRSQKWSVRLVISTPKCEQL